MLEHEDLTVPRKSIFAAVAILLVLLAVNHFTGLLTRIHLQNEETLAMHHGVDTPLYKKMLDELIADTHAEEHWERRLAAVKIGYLGAGAIRAAAALEALLDDKNADVRANAAVALARIGSHSEKAVATLIEILKHGRDHDKFLAANALRLIGPDAKAAITQLVIVSKQGHRDVQTAATEALHKIKAQ